MLLCAAALIPTACVGPPLEIVPEELPRGIVGERYSTDLDVVGSGATSFQVESGRLPDGLDLSSSNGELSGRPQESGEFVFRVRADRGGFPRRTGEQSYRLIVRAELRIAAQPPTARVDVPYQFTPTISGGLPPYQVSVVGLPAGLISTIATGTISGTPLADRDSIPLEFTVIDSQDPPQSATRRATLAIRPPSVQIVTDSLDSGEVGAAYTQRLTAERGRTPFLWTVVDGVLPAGLVLNRATGVISGTPTVVGISTLRVSVEDSDSPVSSDERSFTIVVSADAVTLDTSSLADAVVGAPYTATLAASGGVTPYRFEVSGGALPAGLVLNAQTGELSGTPTVVGTATFRIRVTDSAPAPTRQSRELTVQVRAG